MNVYFIQRCNPPVVTPWVVRSMWPIKDNTTGSRTGLSNLVHGENGSIARRSASNNRQYLLNPLRTQRIKSAKQHATSTIQVHSVSFVYVTVRSGTVVAMHKCAITSFWTPYSPIRLSHHIVLRRTMSAVSSCFAGFMLLRDVLIVLLRRSISTGCTRFSLKRYAGAGKGIERALLFCRSLRAFSYRCIWRTA